MKRVIFLMIIGVLGCKGGEPETTKSAEASATTQNTATQENPGVQLEEKWALEIEGHPRFAGDAVQRRLTKEREQTVSFYGQPLVVRLDIDPSKQVRRLTVGLTEEKTVCVYDSQKHPKKMSLSFDDNRGTFNGEVFCGNVGQPDAEHVATPVKGWFDAKAIPPAPPPKHKMTGAYDKEIPSLPPDNEPQ